MKKSKYPPEMLVKRGKNWEAALLPQLVKHIPSRHKKVLKSFDFSDAPSKQISSGYISGKARTGKTIEAYRRAILWHKYQYCRRLSNDFLFKPVTELLLELRNTYSNNDPAQNEAQVLKKYKNVKLLILDDFGAEKTTEWAYQMLYIILCHRYDNEMTTIYTSNLSLKMLADKLQDDRVPSRITHECGDNIVEFTNKPYI